MFFALKQVSLTVLAHSLYYVSCLVAGFFLYWKTNILKQSSVLVLF